VNIRNFIIPLKLWKSGEKPLGAKEGVTTKNIGGVKKRGNIFPPLKNQFPKEKMEETTPKTPKRFCSKKPQKRAPKNAPQK